METNRISKNPMDEKFYEEGVEFLDIKEGDILLLEWEHPNWERFEMNENNKVGAAPFGWSEITVEIVKINSTDPPSFQYRFVVNTSLDPNHSEMVHEYYPKLYRKFRRQV